MDPLDLSSPTLNADPYGHYRTLLADPTPQWSESQGAWVVSRYDDVRAVLQDRRFSARHTAASIGAARNVDLGLFAKVPSLATTDPPEHTRLRKLVGLAFTPGGVEKMREPSERIVGAALDRAEDRGRLDVVADIASPLPSQIIALQLGVPVERWTQFKQWSDSLFAAFKAGLATDDELRAASESARSLEHFLREEVRSRPAGHPDLLTIIRDAEVDGDRLDEDEVITACMLILVGGNETTTGLIVNGFWALAQDATAMQSLVDDPSKALAAVEEFLRLLGPVHHLSRIALEDVVIGGQTIPKGSRVLLVTAAADRDASQFADSECLRFDRASNQHLAFGRGQHICLGAPLARLEAQIAFTRIFERFQAFECIEPVDVGAAPWVGPLIGRRVAELSFRVTPRRTRGAAR